MLRSIPCTVSAFMMSTTGPNKSGSTGRIWFILSLCTALSLALKLLSWWKKSKIHDFFTHKKIKKIPLKPCLGGWYINHVLSQCGDGVFVGVSRFVKLPPEWNQMGATTVNFQCRNWRAQVQGQWYGSLGMIVRNSLRYGSQTGISKSRDNRLNNLRVVSKCGCTGTDLRDTTH